MPDSGVSRPGNGLYGQTGLDQALCEPQRQIAFYLETWITMHEDLRTRPSCRVTFEALVSGLQQHVGAAKS